MGGARGALADLGGLVVGAAAIVLQAKGTAAGRAGGGLHEGGTASADNVDAASGIGEHAGGAIVAQAVDDRRDGDDALVTELRGASQSVIVGCIAGEGRSQD